MELRERAKMTLVLPTKPTKLRRGPCLIEVERVPEIWFLYHVHFENRHDFYVVHTYVHIWIYEYIFPHIIRILLWGFYFSHAINYQWIWFIVIELAKKWIEGKLNKAFLHLPTFYHIWRDLCCFKRQTENRLTVEFVQL